MGITNDSPIDVGSVIPGKTSAVENAFAEQNRAGSRNNLLSQSPVAHAREMGNSDYMVAFSGQAHSSCVGIVDMIDSTKISANMHEREWCKYYAIFLNSMSEILYRFGGVAVKNGGDSLVYYFPESANTKRKFGFISCLECSFAMIEAREKICEFIKRGLTSIKLSC